MGALALIAGGSRAPCTDIAAPPSSSNREKDATAMSRISARKRVNKLKDIAPDVAARALWWAFPARSENELCERAALVLGKSPDTYRRILRRETRAAWEEVWPILAIAAAARGIDVLEWLGTPHETEAKGLDRASVVRGADAHRPEAAGAVGASGLSVEPEIEAGRARGDRAA